MGNFKGKAIYQPAGKAAEYSAWACNLYNGCSGRCTYCYNRHGVAAKILGADKPTLKKSLINFDAALLIFQDELIRNADEIRKHGLFFNFVSDPCLKETYDLNSRAWFFCRQLDIPVKILTKQTRWVDDFLSTGSWDKRQFAIGFTLTGHDELETGAATNANRIRAMKVLNDAGFKTWASIEPIIDFKSSLNMFHQTDGYCDLYKIGLQSGKSYNQTATKLFIDWCMVDLHSESKIYWKDSLLKIAGVNRTDLPENCVDRDYNIFET